MIAFIVISVVVGLAFTGFVIRPLISAPKWVAPAVLGGILALALGAYALNGQPQMDGVPYAEASMARAMADPATLSPDERIELLFDTVRENPEDAQSWARLGSVLSRMERELEAVNAFQRSLRIELSARTLSDLGQTYINMNDGTVIPEAVAAFEEAQRLDENLPEVPFFLGLAAFQAGNVDEAEAQWLGILARLDPTDPYRIVIAQQAFQLLSQPQVSADAVSEAAQSDDFDPQARIGEMIGRVEGRIAAGDAGFSDYLRLIRIRGMMQDEAGAAAALMSARERFMDDRGAMAILDLLAAALQIAPETNDIPNDGETE